MQTNLLGNGDVLVQIVAASEYGLVIYLQARETETLHIVHLAVDAQEAHHTKLRAEVYLALRGTNGSIEIELGTEQTIFLEETAKRLCLRIEDGESILGGYPKHTLIVLHDAHHRIVGQTIGSGIVLDVALAFLVGPVAIHTITIAAHPYLAILGLAERHDLVEDTTLRIIQLIRMIGYGEISLASTTRLEIYLHHAQNATHQEFAILSHQPADAASDVETVREWQDELLALHIIEEQAIVATYPHTVIDSIVSQGANEGEHLLVSIAHQETGEFARLAQWHHGNAPTPGTYPKVAMTIGSEGGHAVVRQTGVCHRIVSETFRVGG